MRVTVQVQIHPGGKQKAFTGAAGAVVQPKKNDGLLSISFEAYKSVVAACITKATSKAWSNMYDGDHEVVVEIL